MLSAHLRPVSCRSMEIQRQKNTTVKTNRKHPTPFHPRNLNHPLHVGSRDIRIHIILESIDINVAADQKVISFHSFGIIGRL